MSTLQNININGLKSVFTKFGKCKDGFTLVEFLVVIGLLSITITAIMGYLVSTIKGSNQANIISEAGQNGQLTLESLEKSIRGGKFVGNWGAIGAPALPVPSPGVSSSLQTLAVQQGSGWLYIICVSPVSGVSNGWIGQATGADVALAPSAVSSYSAVTNTDPVSGVSITSCSFNINNGFSTLHGPSVTIDFVLSQGINAPSRQDSQVNLEFKSTVELRKY